MGTREGKGANEVQAARHHRDRRENTGPPTPKEDTPKQTWIYPYLRTKEASTNGMKCRSRATSEFAMLSLQDIREGEELFIDYEGRRTTKQGVPEINFAQ